MIQYKEGIVIFNKLNLSFDPDSLTPTLKYEPNPKQVNFQATFKKTGEPIELSFVNANKDWMLEVVTEPRHNILDACVAMERNIERIRNRLGEIK